MEAGKLGHRIIIEQASETQTVGEPVLAWSTFATVWADYEDFGGTEGPAGGQGQFATMRRRYVIRYRSGVVPKMRVNHNGLWDIDVVSNPTGRNREMHLFCTGRGL